MKQKQQTPFAKRSKKVIDQLTRRWKRHKREIFKQHGWNENTNNKASI